MRCSRQGWWKRGRGSGGRARATASRKPSSRWRRPSGRRRASPSGGWATIGRVDGRASARGRSVERIDRGGRAGRREAVRLDGARQPAPHAAPGTSGGRGVRRDAGSARATPAGATTDGVAPIASMASYLPGARDGWDWYVDLRRSLDRRPARSTPSSRPPRSARSPPASTSPSRRRPRCSPRRARRRTRTTWRVGVETRSRISTPRSRRSTATKAMRLASAEGAIRDELSRLPVRPATHDPDPRRPPRRAVPPVARRARRLRSRRGSARLREPRRGAREGRRIARAVPRSRRPDRRAAPRRVGGRMDRGGDGPLPPGLSRRAGRARGRVAVRRGAPPAAPRRPGAPRVRLRRRVPAGVAIRPRPIARGDPGRPASETPPRRARRGRSRADPVAPVPRALRDRRDRDRARRAATPPSTSGAPRSSPGSDWRRSLPMDGERARAPHERRSPRAPAGDGRPRVGDGRGASRPRLRPARRARGRDRHGRRGARGFDPRACPGGARRSRASRPAPRSRSPSPRTATWTSSWSSRSSWQPPAGALTAAAGDGGRALSAACLAAAFLVHWQFAAVFAGLLAAARARLPPRVASAIDASGRLVRGHRRRVGSGPPWPPGSGSGVAGAPGGCLGDASAAHRVRSRNDGRPWAGAACIGCPRPCSPPSPVLVSLFVPGGEPGRRRAGWLLGAWALLPAGCGAPVRGGPDRSRPADALVRPRDPAPRRARRGRGGRLAPGARAARSPAPRGRARGRGAARLDVLRLGRLALAAPVERRSPARGGAHGRGRTWPAPEARR